MRGHREKFKNSLVKHVQVHYQQRTKSTAVLAYVIIFHTFPADVSQALLQSTESLKRDISTNQTKHLSLSSEKYKTS